MNPRHLASFPALFLGLSSTVSAAPTVTTISPTPDTSVASLTSISITFSEPVSNVDVVDLEVNGVTAAGLTGSGAGPYVFTFSQPGPGTVSASWDFDHGIAGTAATGSFVPTAGWGYTLADTIAPTVGKLTTTVAGQEMDAISPSPSASVAVLTETQVTFSEPVTGVEAADLLVNGTAATGVTGSDAGPYTFTFPAPTDGPVTFQWTGTPGIIDGAGNPFAGGGTWSVTKAASLGTVVISEFLAANAGALAATVNGTRDENFDLSPWLELTNTGGTTVDLTGWSLTDDLEKPDQWVFSTRSLAPGARLVVWCSGKDRKPATGHLHTNFSLNPTGGSIALFAPASPQGTAVSSFLNYPAQRYDYSYGSQATDNAVRFFSPPTVTQTAYTLPTAANPTPTPPVVPLGAANGSSTLTSVTPNPSSSVSRGFFNEPFQLILSCSEPAATVRYTLNGSLPTASSTTYAGPLTVSSTTVLRMAAFATDRVPSEIITQSYIFLENVMAQPSPPYDNPTNANDNANPKPPSVGGSLLPVHWGTSTNGFPGQITNLSTNQVPADYGLDPKVHADPNKYTDAGVIDAATGVTNAERINRALRELPILSVVMKIEDMWGTGGTPATGLYPQASETDKTDRTKPCSLELLETDGTTVFATSCGIDLHGNASRAPYKNPKHGFTLKFKGKFGSGKLEAPLFPDSPVREWDKLILRGDFNSSWTHWSGGTQRPKGIRIRDAWCKDSFRDMGRIAGHHRYTNLFINGVYWGTYDLAEDQSDDFAASYFGGSKSDYDVVEQGILKAGTRTVYNAMAALPITAGNNAQYEAMKAVLEVPWFIDYMLFHFLTGHQDWGGDINKNWYAVRNRNNGKFKYLPWDQENLLWNATDNSTAVSAPPTGLHTKLVNNAQYRLDFADRVHKHMVAPDGALTPAANLARLNKWTAIMNADAMCLESARWGDYRMSVHRYSETPYDQVYTWSGKWYDNGTIRSNTANTNNWLSEVNRLKNTYFPVRTLNVLNQLRPASPVTRMLYPRLNAPEFRDGADTLVGSQPVPAGWLLKMTLPTPAPTGTTSAGTILFTTDGSDPRVYYDTTGAQTASAVAYAAPIPIAATTTVKARALDGTTWSALMEATFSVGSPLPAIRITEINYNPKGSQGGAAAEFVEVQNTGPTAVDLGTWSFEGIEFIFPVGQILGAGDGLIIASNNAPATFAARYPGVAVAGYFGGNLNNDGERLSLYDKTGRLISSVEYDNVFPWPTAADNGGYSLEVIDANADLQSPFNWQASNVLKGTPGAANSPPTAAPIIISEFRANGGGSALPGADADYVELFNPGVAPIDIGGWVVHSSAPDSSVTLPAGTQLGGGNYLTIYATSVAVQGQLPTALDSTHGKLTLTSAGGVRIDGVSYGPQAAGFSFGRTGGVWQLGNPTPNAANNPVATGPPGLLRLNEWLADPAPGEDDWLELSSLDANHPVVLTGLLLEKNGEVQRVAAPAAVAGASRVRLFCDPGSSRQDTIPLSLPASGAVLGLRDAGGTLIDSLTYGVQQPGVSQGRLPDSTGPVATLAYPSPGLPNYAALSGTPILSEVLVTNRSGLNAPWGGRPAWIELQNPAAATVALGGWKLRTIGDSPQAWTFPPGVETGAGGHLALWCDQAHPASTAAAASLNTGLDLTDGRVHWGLELVNPLGQIADRVTWGFQVPDRSIGRRTDLAWGLLDSPTFGAANTNPVTLGLPGALKLNEWLARSVVGSPEYFELFNSGATPVALGGLWVSDEPSEVGRRKWQIPALTFIAGGGHVAFWPADSTTSPQSPSFHLDTTGEALRLGLDDAGTTAVDFVVFGEAPPVGSSEGRQPDGAATISVMLPTPGATNAGSVLPTYAAWAASHGVGASSADADADGLNNGAEFLAATNPLVASIADRAGIPQPVGIQDLGGIFYFIVDARLSDRVTYSKLLGELSPDLQAGTWLAKPPDLRQTLSTDPDGIPRVRLGFAIPSNAPHHFLRLTFEP